MVQQLFGSVSFLGEISCKAFRKLEFHGNTISFAHLPEDDMSFLNPSGTFLYFDFFEVLLLWQEPVYLFGCWEVCNAERLDSATQCILGFKDEYVFGGEGKDLCALKTTDTTSEYHVIINMVCDERTSDVLQSVHGVFKQILNVNARKYNDLNLKNQLLMSKEKNLNECLL